MLFTLGVLFVAFGIAASIALHEIGHLLPAKRFGVRVPKYMVGFGPTLWSRTRGDTEYGVKAIPLGGYVKLIGMLPPGRERRGPGRFGRLGEWVSALVEDARKDDADQVGAGDENRVFYKLPTGKKVIVMLGGPTMNLLICAVLTTGVVTLNGVGQTQPGAFVASVARCVLPQGTAPAADGSTPPCAATDPIAPAFAAGIAPGDVILAIDGQNVADATAVGKLVRPRAGQATSVLVRHDGQQVTRTVTPIENVVPVLDADGRVVTNTDGSYRTTTAGYLGVSTSDNVEIVRQPITAAPSYVWQQFTGVIGIVVRLPERVADVGRAAFTSAPRDPNGPMSIVGAGRLGGDIASMPAAPGEDATAGKIATLLMLIASLNMALFVFNLIPLPPLDGGHVAGALYEGARRRVARATGRPDPGHADVAKLLPIAMGIGALFVGMSILLIYADLVKPVKLGG